MKNKIIMIGMRWLIKKNSLTVKKIWKIQIDNANNVKSDIFKLSRNNIIILVTNKHFFYNTIDKCVKDKAVKNRAVETHCKVLWLFKINAPT